MKNRITTSIILFAIICLSFFYACTKSEQPQLSNLQLKCGVAKVSGTIKNMPTENAKSAAILVYSYITMEYERVKVVIDPTGHFQVDVPIEVSPIVAIFDFGSNGGTSFVITADQETKIELQYDENTIVSPSVYNNRETFMRLTEKITDHAFDIDFISKEIVEGFVKDPATYIPFVMDIELKPRLKLIEEEKKLSPFERDYFFYSTKSYVARKFFDFHSTMKLYTKLTQGEGEPIPYTPPTLNAAYYTFLKDFDLNNPQYLSDMGYPGISYKILTDTTLAIPPIGDTPVDQWLGSIEERMTKLVGFSTGQFYDMLIGNAYALQFMNETKPLSATQISNIKEYFGGGEVEKILLRKNEEIEEIVPLEEEI